VRVRDEIVRILAEKLHAIIAAERATP